MPTVYSSSNKQSRKPAISHSDKTHVRRDSMGPLTAFAQHPETVKFETQEEAEEVVLFLRQHVIVNFPWVALVFVLFIAPSILFPLFFQNVKLPFEVPSSYLIVGTLIWYLGTFGFFLASFINWFFNIYIVTNERLVDIDFLHLLYKHFSQAELYRIQEISYSTGGIAGTFFNYGNVVIQTAGETPNLEFEKVPFPERVVQTVRHQMEELRNQS